AVCSWPAILSGLASAADLGPQVELEEDVYSYTQADNGAGPMWCSGSTCIVRSGDRVFVSGLQTVPDVKPLNNCRWMLFSRDANGWRRVQRDANGLTREPSPLAAFADGRIFLSVNPTLEPGEYAGAAQPDVLQFDALAPSAPPTSLGPSWQGSPRFREHSYRSFAADGHAGQLILFQNIGYTHAEWTFRDSAGQWSAQGQLKWPWGAEYETPKPIRVCYPNVALRDREVHFFGVSDVVEPNTAFRQFKLELTGQKWDYDFRRLFYTWTPDVTDQPFTEWVEIASREQTGGRIQPGDLWLAPNGDVHVLWSERAIDERLREKFFPDAQQSQALNYAVIRAGKVVQRRTIVEKKEGTAGIVGTAGRFHATPDHRLFVVHLASGTDTDGSHVHENRLVEVLPHGGFGPPLPLPLEKPFTNFFTTTERGGSPPSWTVEMFGLRSGNSNTLSYARVQLK
ncbi:MAG: hypothetical protein KDA45_16525, partial [Planctomycetales bacterium]|nr:hypothetical protein [Planctomycetales bacterium]